MTTPPTAPGRSRRSRAPRDWSLRVKLGVVLLVPGLLAVVLGALRILDQTGQAAEADRVGQVATAEGDVSTLVERLQTERIAAAAFVAGNRRGDPAPLVAAGVAADRSARPVTVDVEPLAGDAHGDITVQARRALSDLPALRSDARTSGLTASVIDGRYGDVIGRIGRLDQALLRDVGDAPAADLVGGLTGLTNARDEMAVQLALVSGARSAPPVALFVPMVESNARLTSALAQFRASLDPGRQARFGGLVGGPTDVARQAVAQRLLTGAAGNAMAPATFVAVGPAYGAFLTDIDHAGTGLRGDLTQMIATQRAGAMQQVVVNAVLLLLSLLIGAVIVGRLARQMLTSLRTLRTSALEVARRRIPEAVARMREGGMPDVDIQPVPVQSQEEIGEVARAFDAVHQQAVRLAAEQATLQSAVNSMFVNLSRRSQTLVDRQLQLIEELERNEQDAEQLANLFRLDHLATRVRRNSENLLALAGTDLSKRAAHRVPVVDVLRAAVSETEQYERITLDQQPAVAVAGRAANDLQHLVAELLDNATGFSAHGSPVLLGTTPTPTGALIIEIVDHGVGMAAPDLAAANGLLGQRSDVSVTASQQMGLFVVARLAARHGIVVRLVTGAPPIGGGTPGLTARVTVPKNVVFTGSAARGGARTDVRTGRAETVSDQHRGGPALEAQSGVGPAGAGPTADRPGETATVGDQPGEGRPDLIRPVAAPAVSDPTAPPPSIEVSPGPTRPEADQDREARPSARPAAAQTGTAPSAMLPLPVSQPPVPQPPVSQPAAAQSTGAEQASVRTTIDDATGTGGQLDEAPPAPRPEEASPPQPRPAAGPHQGVPAPGSPDEPDADARRTLRAGELPVQRGGSARPDRRQRLLAITSRNRPEPTGPSRSESRPGGSAETGTRGAAGPGGAADTGGRGPVRPAEADPDAVRIDAPAVVGGRTPLFQEPSSGWFRSYRQVPVNWAADPWTGEKPPAITAGSSSLAAPTHTTGPSAAGGTLSFVGPADEEWRTAAARLAGPPEPALTHQGLPRRTPGARLIPGSREAAAFSLSHRHGGPPRDADAIRDRLHGYQRGVQRGREGQPNHERGWPGDDVRSTGTASSA